ncbi:MAG: hypothetical protein ACOCW1_04015 [Chitinispirillaceae bacterium]
MLKQLAPICLALLFLAQVPSAQERSIVRFGEDVVVREGEQILDAVSIGGDVRVEGEVTNDAVAVGGSLFLGTQASVGGSAVSIGGKINQAEGAVVRGDIVEMNTPWDIPSEAWFGLFIGFQILIFIGFLALALLAVGLLPRQVEAVSHTAIEATGKSFLWGFLILLGIIPVTLLLVITIIGITIIPVLFLLLIVLFIFGYIGIANLIGKQIFKGLGREKAAMIWKALVGLLLLGAVNWIPIFGGLVGFLASVWGVGAVVEALVQYRGTTRTEAFRKSEPPTKPPEDNQ